MYEQRIFVTNNPLSVRANECLIDSDHNHYSNFNQNCMEYGNSNLIFLWGDSHSAHLYPGLKALQNNNNFRIAQYNTGSCPPILGFDFKYVCGQNCQENNNYIFNKISSLKDKKIVILSFSLSRLHFDDIKRIKQTIEKLSTLNNIKVILIGTVPAYEIKYFYDNFLKLVLRISGLNNNHIPFRNKIGLQNLEKEEQILKNIAKETNIKYISLIDTLCNKDGCILKTEDNDNGEIITYDGGHLTEAGSVFVIEKIKDQILQEL